MPKRIAGIILILVVLSLMYGCSRILDGEVSSTHLHNEPVETSPPDGNIVEAATYEDIVNAVLDFVSEHKESGVIRFNNYDGDVERDVESACLEVWHDTPLGAYAVYYMSYPVTRIVSYYEAEIGITYNRTKEQVDSIVPASTWRYIQYGILNCLENYSAVYTVSTKVKDLSSDDFTAYVEELYYSNPLDIVARPAVSINVFPDLGDDKIFEVIFEYPYPERRLTRMTGELDGAAQKIIESVSGDNDADIFLSICNQLIAITNYDVEAAESGIVDDSPLTAYGALVNNLAVGEGYAMAYKALCDKLGLECYVVVGRLNRAAHAWNIIGLENSYYHVDLAMCAVNGIETAFLLRDEDIISEYWWDTMQYETCTGDLTYQGLFGIKENPEQPLT